MSILFTVCFYHRENDFTLRHLTGCCFSPSKLILPPTPAQNTHVTDSTPLRLTGRHFLGFYNKAHPDCNVCSVRKDGK